MRTGYPVDDAKKNFVMVKPLKRSERNSAGHHVSVSGYLKTGCLVNSKRRKGGIPDQKGVLELNRGFPEVSLILQNNKVWQGAVALQFNLLISSYQCGSSPKKTVIYL